MTDDHSFDISAWGTPLPYDHDARGGVPTMAGVLGDTPAFAYVGKALTLAEFDAYLATYDFGPIPPDWIMLHHTAVPTVAQWTVNEAGLTDAQIKDKRLRQVTGIKNYYQNTLHWNAGPHIFVDDRWLYLMTPMADIGIHARDGNSTKINGRLHYSIGIEVVGDYTHQLWSVNTALTVASVVARLLKRLGNFQLIDGRVPGTIDAHRHHGKPACPGDAIQPSYYLPLFQKAYDALSSLSHYTAGYGASVRSGAGREFPRVRSLVKGEPWSGITVKGGMVADEPGFPPSDEWVRSAEGSFVWKPLLIAAK